ncbi:MAG: tRNA pseudouridine(38-40) synthase TruA [Actinomycetota bacterium]|nr:tRNA pseudouridine(38-40) synthase TruA [Actinomycetota bacterium]
MTNNYMAVVEYDGTNYSGFQIQPGGVNTIQGQLEAVFSKILDREIDLKYAGRTDAGVHAAGQVISFNTKRKLDIYRIKWSLNSMLPEDIVIKEIKKAAASFNARRDAVLREYSYFVVNKEYQSVFLKRYSILINRKLDIRAMRRAAKMFTGVKDFGSFCNPECISSNTVRKVYRFTVEKTKYGMVIFKIAANSFLYNMVRIIIGTVLEIGEGKRVPENIGDALKKRDRNLAGKIVPAKGLFLTAVEHVR